METRKIKLAYPLSKIGVPVFSRLASDFDVEPNVLAADINHNQGGWMVLNISGETSRLDGAESWIRDQGITVSAAI